MTSGIIWYIIPDRKRGNMKDIKENSNIKVTWFMNKYQATDTRHGIYDHKSKQWTTPTGVPCVTFWDTLRKRYTTATNYALSILGENA